MEGGEESPDEEGEGYDLREGDSDTDGSVEEGDSDDEDFLDDKEHPELTAKEKACAEAEMDRSEGDDSAASDNESPPADEVAAGIPPSTSLPNTILKSSDLAKGLAFYSSSARQYDILQRAPPPFQSTPSSSCPTYSTLTYNEKEALLEMFAKELAGSERSAHAANLLFRTFNFRPDTLSITAVDLPLDRATRQTQLLIEITLHLAARRARLGANLVLVSTAHTDARADRTKLMKCIDQIIGHSPIDGTTMEDRRRIRIRGSSTVRECCLDYEHALQAICDARRNAEAAVESEAMEKDDGGLFDFDDDDELRASEKAARSAEGASAASLELLSALLTALWNKCVCDKGYPVNKDNDNLTSDEK